LEKISGEPARRILCLDPDVIKFDKRPKDWRFISIVGIVYPGSGQG